MIVRAMAIGLILFLADLAFAGDKAPPRKPIRVLVPVIREPDAKVAAARLRGLKFDVVLVPWDKLEPDRVKDVDVIFLPSCWADDKRQVDFFEEAFDTFHQFVRRGGGLFVCQPNPGPIHPYTPKLLPHPITFKRHYDDTDTARVNLDPDHYITEDLPGDAMPFPFDAMQDLDKRYKVLARQKSTGFPSLAVVSFGDGRVLVQTANEAPGAIVSFSDELLRRMVAWTAGREK